MADIEKKQPQNPIKAMEQQIAAAKSVKDILKVDFARNRYVANFQAMSGREDGLQQYESEVLNFIELANNKPEIMNADKFSIVAGFMRAAVWNLSFMGNDLSVYVRSNKLVVEPQAHGKRKLIEKMPGVKEVHEGVLVFKNDTFDYDPDNEMVHKHVQKWPRPEATPDSVVGAYCKIEFTDGSKKYIVVDANEIAKARKASKMQDGGMLWTTYYGEACKKTAYNRAFKVKWRKPEAAVLYQQWEAPEGDEQTAPLQDANVIEPDMPEATSTQQTPPPQNTQVVDAQVVDTDTGEVLNDGAQEPKQQSTARKSRRGATDGNLDL